MHLEEGHYLAFLVLLKAYFFSVVFTGLGPCKLRPYPLLNRFLSINSKSRRQLMYAISMMRCSIPATFTIVAIMSLLEMIFAKCGTT